MDELITRQKVIVPLCKNFVHCSLRNQDVETRIAYKMGKAEFIKVWKWSIKGLKIGQLPWKKRLKRLGLFNLNAR